MMLPIAILHGITNIVEIFKGEYNALLIQSL